MVDPSDPDRARPAATGHASDGRRVFRHGAASGDPTPTGVVLWTRVHETGDQPVPVSWSIWDEDGGPAGRGRAWAVADEDHTCHVVVEDLRPGTGYHYVFEARGDRIVGHTRTLPETSRGFRFAVACCSRWGWPGFDDYAAILAESPDLVLHLGDYIYEIGEIPPDGPATDPPFDCVSLDDYRRRYRQHRGVPALQRLHAEIPMLAVWDDHEVADNAPDDPNGERRRAGQQAWREWMPTRATASEPALDRHVHIDGLLELVLVDARFGGRPPTDTDGPSTSRPDTTLLTESQWDLVESAAAVETPWFVVANQVQVARLTLGWVPALRWPPWRRLVNPDQWDGFPAERGRLVELLDRAAGSPVVLSGDLHAGWARRLLDGDRTIAREFTAPSISGTTFAEAVRSKTGVPAWLTRRLIGRLNPGIEHVDLRRHGFLIIDVDPDEMTVTFVHHDGSRVARTLRSAG